MGEENKQAVIPGVGAGNNGPVDPNANNSNSYANISAVTLKLPAFFRPHPELWLTQAESQFQARGITQDDTKYCHITAALSPDVAMEVWDVIGNPPAAGKYQALKDALISRTAATEREKIQQLLSNETLGDQRPSKLLPRMQQLTTNRQVNDAFLKHLFLQKLPKHVQQILAPVQAASLNELAASADNVCAVQETQPVFNAQLCAVSSAPPNPVSPAVYPSHNAPENVALINAIEALTKQVAALQTQVEHHSRRPRQRYRSQSRRRRDTPHRGASQRRHPFCWHHYKFGAKAENCNAPCDFQTPSENDPSRH